MYEGGKVPSVIHELVEGPYLRDDAVHQADDAVTLGEEVDAMGYQHSRLRQEERIMS